VRKKKKNLYLAHLPNTATRMMVDNMSSLTLEDASQAYLQIDVITTRDNLCTNRPRCATASWRRASP
jgi:hypothetical protein